MGLNGLFFIVGLLGIFAVLVVLGIKETKSFVRTKIVESYNLRNFSFQLIILFLVFYFDDYPGCFVYCDSLVFS